MANKSSSNSNNTSWLQQWLERIWYEGGKGRFLLLPLSLLYCAVNTYQRKMQSRNQVKIPCAIIVVGNITVGGTGKTPLTIHISKLLQKAGHKPAIITRGYGGKAVNWPQYVTASSDTGLVGDEAVLMASRTAVPVYAGANRLESIRELLHSHECDVIISDDGMQHYKLPRDIQIAVIDGERQFGNGYCLPAGPLREKKGRLDDCDLVIVNGKNKSQNHWYSMILEGNSLTNLKTRAEINLGEFKSKRIHGVTGIGNPQRFFSSLEQKGFDIIKHSFPDHYIFKQSDLSFNDGLDILMTEKDAVKCRNFATDKYWYLPVEAQIDESFDNQLLILLENTIDIKNKTQTQS